MEQSNQVNLANIFRSVTQSLIDDQQDLNQADEYNKDHGSNMVGTFQIITQALEEKQGRSDSAALAYAAKRLSKSTTSSSGKLYAQGLTQASQQFKGKQVDSRSAMSLLQTLIGGGQAPSRNAGSGDMFSTLLTGMAQGGGAQPQAQTSGTGNDVFSALQGGTTQGDSQQDSAGAGGDLLGALLGGMGGGGTQQESAGAGGDLLGALLGGMGGGGTQQESAGAGGDLLGTLLGGMSGGSSSGGGLKDGLDAGDLLKAGLAYMQAKQQGASNLQALIQAFVGASGMGRSPHRAQSTEVVVNSFLQALAGVSGK